jgi:hypothetical protein
VIQPFGNRLFPIRLPAEHADACHPLAFARDVSARKKRSLHTGSEVIDGQVDRLGRNVGEIGLYRDGGSGLHKTRDYAAMVKLHDRVTDMAVIKGHFRLSMETV